MAKRYRYAFAKKKESSLGKVSIGTAAASPVLFLAAILVAFIRNGDGGVLTGGFCIFAMLLSIYGFIQGLRSFSVINSSHRFSIIGSIANGILMVTWLGLFLIGV